MLEIHIFNKKVSLTKYYHWWKSSVCLYVKLSFGEFPRLRICLKKTSKMKIGAENFKAVEAAQGQKVCHIPRSIMFTNSTYNGIKSQALD